MLRFTLKIENRGSGPASGLNLQDTEPANTTYVPNSTAVSFNGAAATPTWTAVSDSGSTAFPLDEGGNGFPNPPNTSGASILAGKSTYLVRFLVTIANPNPPDPAVIEICNTGTWSTTSAGQVSPGVCVPLNVFDWGDLPDGTISSTTYEFPTLLSRKRRAAQQLRPVPGGRGDGNRFDRETNGAPSVNADRDNATNLNDEKGVSFAAYNSVNVTVSGGDGCLNAWMDFTNDTGSGVGATNRDFNFTKTAGGYETYTSGGTTYSEYIIQNTLVTAAADPITFPAPLGCSTPQIWSTTSASACRRAMALGAPPAP